MSTVTKETFWTLIVEDPTLYGTITTEDNLFNYRSDAVWQVMNETFIANGGVFEVTKWEELLGLDVVETTLNSRKAAILNHITENLPITIGILEQLLKEITNDDYTLVYDETENKLTLEFPENFENNIKEIAPRLIPIVSEINYKIGLPAGYFAAEFLESTNTQYISIKGLENTDIATQELDLQRSTKEGRCFTGFSWNTYQFLLHESGRNTWEITNANVLDRVIIRQEVNTLTSKSTYVYKDTAREIGCDKGKIYQWGMWCVPNQQSCTGLNLRIFRAKCFLGEELKFEMKPALDISGTPCMHDIVSKESYYNSGTGSFIVGLTLYQSKKLSSLPATGGTLTISLPTGYDTYVDVTSALETARSKGWTLTIQTYTPEDSTSTASTFGMQRIWVRKTQDENGSYVDANGNRFQVEWCVEIYSPENKTPEDLGYEQFRSVESAVEYWELTPYVDPTLEEQFNITNEEQ